MMEPNDPGFDDPGQADDHESGPAASRRGHLTRRDIIVGAVGAVGGGAIGAAGTFAAQRPPARRVAESQNPTRVHGANQAGIARPETPQQFGLIVVVDLAAVDDVSFLPTLGARLVDLIQSPPPTVLPDGPAGLTVTVGLGPRVVSAHRQDGPGGEQLPIFAHDGHVGDLARGGDLLLAAYAEDPTVLQPAVAHLLGDVPNHTLRWSQRCFRGVGHGRIVRNPIGFYDNIQVPTSADDLAENVWLDGELAGGTICVIRRFRLDLAAFEKLDKSAREHTIGRRLDGSPLSGGRPFSQVNVDAKTSAGEYLIPVHAHVRAAHPSFTGSALMLRRGYSYDNGNGDEGLMFVCFQRDLRTFVMTQQRLNELDDLMRYATPTASATFLILPGFTSASPLGHVFSNP